MIDWTSLKCTRGGKVSMRAWNKLLEMCAKAELTIVLGGNLKEGAGKQIIIPPRAGPSIKFRIQNASISSTARIRILRNGGLVGGVIGTFGTEITVDGNGIDAPAGVLEITVSGYVYFHYDYDAETMTVESAATVPADTWDANHVFLQHAYFAIGHVVLTDGRITGIEQSVTTSLGVQIADVVVWG